MCKILCNIIIIDIIITMSKYIIYIYQNVNTHFNIILYQIINTGNQNTYKIYVITTLYNKNKLFNATNKNTQNNSSISVTQYSTAIFAVSRHHKAKISQLEY